MYNTKGLDPDEEWEIEELKKSLCKHMQEWRSMEEIKTHSIWKKLDSFDSERRPGQCYTMPGSRAFVQQILVKACFKYLYASVQDRIDLVTWLIEEKGAQVNQPGLLYQDDSLPIVQAVRREMDLAKFLVSKGAVVTPTICETSWIGMKEEHVEYLFDWGVSPLSKCNSTTLAHYAASQGWITVLKRCLPKINPNLRDSRNKTLLEVAVDCYKPEVVSLLIEHGADPDTHIPPNSLVDPDSGYTVGRLNCLEDRYSGAMPRSPCCICGSMLEPYIGHKKLIYCKTCALNAKRKLLPRIAAAFRRWK